MGKIARRRYKAFKSGVKTTYQVANKALDTALKVKRLINPELKIIDFSQTGTVPSAGTVECLSLVGQGTGDNTRTGVSIKYNTLRINWFVGCSTATTTGTTNNIRIIVFKDASSNGVMPTVAQVLQNAGVLSQYNNQNKDRFRILSDRTYSLSMQGIRNKLIRTQVYLGTHGYYNGAGNTITEVRTQNVFVLFIGTNTTAETNYSLESRIWFYDN